MERSVLAATMAWAWTMRGSVLFARGADDGDVQSGIGSSSSFMLWAKNLVANSVGFVFTYICGRYSHCKLNYKQWRIQWAGPPTLFLEKKFSLMVKFYFFFMFLLLCF